MQTSQGIRNKLVVALALGMALLPPPLARALINPNFTPVNLVAGADRILLLQAQKIEDRQGRLAVTRVLKGQAASKTATLDLTVSAFPEQIAAIRKLLLDAGAAPILLFQGKGENDAQTAKLHLGGKWINLDPGQTDDAWDVDAIDGHMEATWAGGTDMLLQMTELLLKCPELVVPTTCSGSWEEPLRLGVVSGRVERALAVDLTGSGRPALYLAATGGDRIFAYDHATQKFEDRTAALGLAAQSRAAAWGDFNGDGRLDLASADGQALVLWLQATNGTFAPRPVANVPAAACLGLSTLEVGDQGGAGLLWSSVAAPLLRMPDAHPGGALAHQSLAAEISPAWGAPGACLVADFDGDGYADVIQPFARRSLFFKGQGRGAFAAGAPCQVALGAGRAAALLGDWNMDGRLDIFTVAEDALRLWQNEGAGVFADRYGVAGELTYIAKPGALAGNACDVNGDGIQDLFLAYPSMGAQLFFNRGFRSFGHAHRPIDLAETGNLPAALQGQQTGLLADFTGDNLPDMALVLRDGTVYLLPQSPAGNVMAVLRVALPPGPGCAGPVTLVAEDANTLLGAWSIAPGTAEALLTLSDPGPMTVTWRLPGGEPVKRTYQLTDRPKRVLIGH